MATSPRGCLDDQAVSAFVIGEIGPAARAEIEQHLGACDDCALLVAEFAKFFFQTAEPQGSPEVMASLASGAGPPEAELPAGTRVSRYVLERLLGRGGAGTVYEASDPQLKRQVAIKLVQAPPTPGLDPAEAQARLLREAEAMARLSHPNVVNVYDAGIVDTHVFIVMERIEGEPLSAWLRSAERSAAEIVEVFVGAGRGLEAAHAAGLVHRDFKPQNVLVGRDGRPRVTDFGLARAAGGPPVGPAVAPGRRATIAGGTPLFMAPEQHRGEPATALSDQFAFALALYRSLYARDPFGLEARRTWASGAPGPGPDAPAAAVPARVRDAVLRALSPAAQDRFPTMGALLEALVEPAARPWPARLPWRRLAIGAIAAAALAGGLLGARWLALRPSCGNGVVEPGEECDDGNASDRDGCRSTCRLAVCGDGRVRAPVEECDDLGAGCAACRRCAGDAGAFVSAEDGRCYSRHRGPLTFDEAVVACRSRGADLVGYGSAAEAVAVARVFSRAPDLEAWIGLRRAQREYGFIWLGGEPWADPLPRWWSDVDKPPGQDCVFQVKAPARPDIPISARWQTAGCNERRGYLCESPSWAVRRPGNHGYRLFPTRVTWWQARDACRALGAHLATLADVEESSFVSRLGSVDAWIGAISDKPRDPFVWLTGEPMVFTEFGAREPDQPGRPDCVVIGGDDLWHDRMCNDHFAYMCEAD